MAHSEEQLAPRVRDENLQLGQGLLLDVFGEPAIGDVSEFSDDHLSFVRRHRQAAHDGHESDDEKVYGRMKMIQSFRGIVNATLHTFCQDFCKRLG